MKSIYRTVVSAIILSKDGKILLGKKDPKRLIYDPDCWHLPGGGIDEGESLEDGLQREILEEVGIDITDCKVKLFDNKGNGEAEKLLQTGETVLAKMQFNVFRVDIDKKAADIKIKLDDDLVDAKWFEVRGFQDLKLTPPGVELFGRKKLTINTP